jgi:hypothetical protein
MNRIIPWIIGAVVFLLLVSYIFSGSLMSFSSSESFIPDRAYSGYAGYSDPYLSGRGSDFAPQIEERQYSATATMAIRTDRNSFDERIASMRTIVTGAEGYLLDQNVREMNGAKTGRFSIRVPDDEYARVKQALTELGTVTTLEENMKDVTGTYARTDVELEAERSRLERLRTLYSERSSLNEKLQVERAIFDQERKVRYLENQLSTIDQQVSYSTITLTIQTRPNAFSGHTFITLRNLIGILLGSVQALIAFIVAAGPWAIVAGFIWWLIGRFR